jgi:hypothetical protein
MGEEFKKQTEARIDSAVDKAKAALYMDQEKLDHYNREIEKLREKLKKSILQDDILDGDKITDSEWQEIFDSLPKDLLYEFNLNTKEDLQRFVILETNAQEKNQEANKVEAIEALFGERFVDIARQNLGNPYDTSPTGIDGGALAEYINNGKCRVKNNLTGEISETNKKPFVCTDLIIQALTTMGLKNKIPMKNSDPFDWRRITEVEKAIDETDNFIVKNFNFSIHFPANIIPLNMECIVGDIITITNNENGGRHVGIVTRVDSSGNPLTIIHSSGYRGVVETPFLNSSAETDYNGENRYDGFLYGNAKINKIIRPSQSNMFLAMKNMRAQEAI